MGWGNIRGVPGVHPTPPPKLHTMAFLWVALCFLLVGNSFGKRMAQAGLAHPQPHP